MKAWRNVLLRFGMVAVPVAISPAKVSGAEIESHRYGPSGERIRQAWTEDGATILDPSEIVSRFAAPSGEAVEIERPEIPGENGIDLTALVASSSVDPLFYDAAYALNAGKGGGRPFAALAAALEDRPGACLVGTARFTDRPRDVLIRYSPETDSLVLHTLSFGAKVRAEEMTAEAAKLPAPEAADIAAASSFLDSLPGDFNLTREDPMDVAIRDALAAALPNALTPPAPGDVTAPRDLLADLRANGLS
jgi:non-homologous end joining protein Ku